jgi:hypothetical protein
VGDIAKTSESMLRLSRNKSGPVVGGEPPAELMDSAINLNLAVKTLKMHAQ